MGDANGNAGTLLYSHLYRRMSWTPEKKSDFHDSSAQPTDAQLRNQFWGISRPMTGHSFLLILETVWGAALQTGDHKIEEPRNPLEMLELGYFMDDQ